MNKLQVIDTCEATMPEGTRIEGQRSGNRRITVMEMVPALLEELQLPENKRLHSKDLQQKFDSDPRWEQLRMATPRLYLKALRGELSSDDPTLQEFFKQLNLVRDGALSKRDAWKRIDKQMTEKYVYPQIGRPDEYGRPKGPGQ